MAEGFASISLSAHELLDHEFIVYDVLYAECHSEWLIADLQRAHLAAGSAEMNRPRADMWSESTSVSRNAVRLGHACVDRVRRRECTLPVRLRRRLHQHSVSAGASPPLRVA